LIHYLVYNFTLICVIFSAGSEADSTLEARRHYSWALQYEKGGLWEDALTQYEKAIALAPEDPRYRFALGRLLYNLKRIPEAKAAFFRAIEVDSSYIRAYYALARIYHSEANYDSVIVMYRKILEFDPGCRDVRRRLAELYRYKGMESEPCASSRCF